MSAEGELPRLPAVQAETKLERVTEGEEQPFNTVQLLKESSSSNGMRAAEPASHNPELSFSLGVDPAKLPSETELYKQYPELVNTIGEMSFDVTSGTDIIFPGMQKPVQSNVYKHDAFLQMVAKYGAPRVSELFDTLNRMDPDGLEAYKYELSFHHPDTWPKTNQRLYNMADLCEPGKLEAVKELDGLMRKEGYKQRFALIDMSGPMVGLLRSNTQERTAFINFQNSARDSMLPGVFLGDHLELKDAPPSVQWEKFQNYLKTRTSQH